MSNTLFLTIFVMTFAVFHAIPVSPVTSINPHCLVPATSTREPKGAMCRAFQTGYSYFSNDRACVETTMPCWAKPSTNFFESRAACNKQCFGNTLNSIYIVSYNNIYVGVAVIQPPKNSQCSQQAC